MTWEEAIRFFEEHEYEDIQGYKDEQNNKEWKRLLSKVQREKEKQNEQDE